MSNFISWLWIGATVLGLIDAFRHSPSDWARADRNRPVWMVMLFFFGFVAGAAYLAFVRPRFPKEQPNAEFLKG
jgi:hypothetical protein